MYFYSLSLGTDCHHFELSIKFVILWQGSVDEQPGTPGGQDATCQYFGRFCGADRSWRNLLLEFESRG